MSGDSSQFLIDLAAKFTGGDASVATLAELGDKMLAAGATASDLERTVKQTAAALEDSAAAMDATGNAASEGEKKYRQFEAAADRTAKAVERIGELAEAQRGKLKAALDAGDGKGAERAAAGLRALSDRQSEAAVKAKAAAVAMNAEAAALDTVKGKAAAAAEHHGALVKGLDSIKSAAQKAAKAEAEAGGSGKLSQTAAALGRLGGPAGAAGEKVVGLAEGFHKLGASLGAVGPYIGAAVVIVAISAAAIAATIAIAKWGVGLAEANRTASLLTAGVARSVAGGALLEGTISRLGAVVPQTREELLGMAGDLANSGLRGKELSSALEAAALKAAELKFGPDFAKQMLSLDVQARRLHESIADTFGGLNIEKLLGGVSTLTALFDSTTASGRVLKFLFESLFQPIIDAVAAVAPDIERFFLQAEILALKAYIALKPYSGEIALLGKLLLGGAAIIGGVFAVALVLVVGLVGLLVAGIGALIFDIYEIGVAIEEGMQAILDWTDGVSDAMADMGTRMIQGLVDGITGAAAAVVKAVTDVVGGGIKAAEHLLGIGSPSKVFAGIGDDTAEGYAMGVEGGSGRSQGALEAMVAPPRTKAGGLSGGGSQRGDVVVNITVEGRGESDEGLAAKIAAAVRDVFETDALMLGAGEAAP